MRRIAVLTVVFWMLAIIGIQAQTQKQLIKVADTYFNDRDYYGASLYYHRAMKLDSSSVDLLFKYAESLRLYNEYPKAERVYGQIYKIDRGQAYPLALYWQATMQKHMGDYKNARKNFKRCERYFKKDKKGFHYLKVIQEQLSCDVAEQLLKDTLELQVKNLGLGVNSYDSEFSASLLDSTLYFSSLRAHAMNEQNVVMDSVYVVNIYKSKLENGNLAAAVPLPNDINLPEMHTANAAFSTDMKRMYFTACDLDFSCGIYYSVWKNGNWETAEKLGNEINHTSARNTTHPTMATIGGKEVLFFSSDRNGGKGMMDIWFAWHRGDNRFSEPINAGDIINTIEDEITPFYLSSDSTLYFSSNWHAGLGGFDIFSAKGEPGKFQKPVNMGYPINTSNNETYYARFGHLAFLTSNRKGSYTKKGQTCCNDIYVIEYPKKEEPRVYSSLDELQRYLPVTLYFHNDEPNPRSRDTLTQFNYLTTYTEYLKLENTYKKEYSSGLRGEEKEDAILDIEDYFDQYVRKGLKDLTQFSPLLLKELEKGTSIELSIKGYASPLSKTDYNVNLTLRRISSLINFINEYQGGVFKPYLNGTAQNGAILSFVKIPFGEYKSNDEVSDNINDLKNSVYSRKAALERKIEIMAIRLTGEDTTGTGKEEVGLDGTLVADPQAHFPRTNIPVSLAAITSSEQVKIAVQNTGKAPLRFFSYETSNPAFQLIFPITDIAPGETDYILFTSNPGTSATTGVQIIFSLLSNANPNKHKIEITLE